MARKPRAPKASRLSAKRTRKVRPEPPREAPLLARWVSEMLGAEKTVADRLKRDPGAYRKRLIASADFDQELQGVIAGDPVLRSKLIEALSDPRSQPYRAQLGRSVFPIGELVGACPDRLKVGRLWGVASALGFLTNPAQCLLIASVLRKGEVVLWAPDSAANRREFAALPSRLGPLVTDEELSRLAWVAGPAGSFGIGVLPLAVVNPLADSQRVLLGLPFADRQEMHAFVLPSELASQVISELAALFDRIAGGAGADGTMRDESGTWRLVRAVDDPSSAEAERIEALADAVVDAVGLVLRRSRGATPALADSDALADAVRSAVRTAARPRR